MNKIFIGLLLFSISSFGQNKYSSNRIGDQQSILRQYNADIYHAESLNIPLKYINEDGNISEFVRFINDIPIYYKTFNSVSAEMMGANRVYPGGDLGLSLTGSAILVGVWDENRPFVDHIGFTNLNNNFSRLNQLDSDSNNYSQHFTHVMGTILGNGKTNVRGRGIAYEARGLYANWTNDLSEMLSATTNYNVYISNHSYGLDLSKIDNDQRLYLLGKYTNDAHQLDKFLYQYPKYLAVYAAGNDQNKASTYNPGKNKSDMLSSDAVSKNAITVGAINQFSSYLTPESVQMSNFSNWGPTDDFRIKPDIVAKGVSVYSTYFDPNSSEINLYANLNGTSMAAPAVTGAAALIYNYYNSQVESATVKGLLLHTAKEAGPAPGPDHMFGWGVVDVAEAIYTAQEKNYRSKIITDVYNNEEKNYYIKATGLEPLKVSISWTDPAGVINDKSVDDATPSLVNDLDLTVRSSLQTYYPWFLNNDFNNLIALKGKNSVDNFERVDIESPTNSELYHINISSTRSVINQKFTLIITGGTESQLNSNRIDNSDYELWVDKNNILHFRSPSNSDKISIMEIYDLSGRLINDCKITRNVINYDLSMYSKGIYIVRLKTYFGEIFSKKINLY